MIQFRDYQIPAVKALSECKRGILKAPAGSGKTVMGAGAVDIFCRRWNEVVAPKIAWVAMTNEQVDQGKKAISLCDSYDAKQADFFCYAGCPSLAGYDLVVLDECHHISAPFFRGIIKYHGGTCWGLSATPDRADEFKDDVYRLIGPIVYTVDRAPLVAAGQITEARVVIHSPNYTAEMEREINAIVEPEYEKRKRRWPFMFHTPQQQTEQRSRIVWQTALNLGIELNQKRNTAAINIAIENAQDSILMLVGKIEHGEALSLHIPDSMVVFSKMGAKKRREAIAAFGAGDLKCMIATSLADEGLDVPRANRLIQVAAGRSAAKAEQRTGRVLRSFHDAEHGETKTHGTIDDFADLHHYFLAAQSRRRQQVYRSLGYKFI